MTIEQIQTNQGQEQDVIVPYGDITLRISLRFDDYENQWFCKIQDEATNEVYVSGLYLKLETDALFGFGLDFGTLGLVDTDPENAVEVDLKSDLGDRIQLIRDFDA